MVDPNRLRWTHGPDASNALALMWDRQGGRCYLCGDQLDREKAVVDHDHRCCPRGKTCDACRRGYACHRCNRLIGQVGDDSVLLRRIADNLEAATVAALSRISVGSAAWAWLLISKPVQLDVEPPARKRAPVRRRMVVRKKRPVPQMPAIDPRKAAFARELSDAPLFGTTPNRLKVVSGLSNSYTHNLLAALQAEGLIVKVGRGHYRAASATGDIAAVVLSAPPMMKGVTDGEPHGDSG